MLRNMNINLMNLEPGDRAKVCEKFISDATTLTNFLNSVVCYCRKVIEEETYGVGFRGDGGNDPDNTPKNNKALRTSSEIFNQLVVPTFEYVKENDFLCTPNWAEIVGTIVNDSPKILFPKGFFEKTSVDSEKPVEDEVKRITCDGFPFECGSHPWCNCESPEGAGEDQEELVEVSEEDVEAFMAFCKFIRYLMGH